MPQRYKRRDGFSTKRIANICFEQSYFVSTSAKYINVFRKQADTGGHKNEKIKENRSSFNYDDGICRDSSSCTGIL